MSAHSPEIVHVDYVRGMEKKVFLARKNIPLTGILRNLYQFIKSNFESGISLNIIFFYNHPNCRRKAEGSLASLFHFFKGGEAPAAFCLQPFVKHFADQVNGDRHVNGREIRHIAQFSRRKKLFAQQESLQQPFSVSETSHEQVFKALFRLLVTDAEDFLEHFFRFKTKPCIC